MENDSRGCCTIQEGERKITGDGVLSSNKKGRWEQGRVQCLITEGEDNSCGWCTIVNKRDDGG